MSIRDNGRAFLGSEPCNQQQRARARGRKGSIPGTAWPAENESPGVGMIGTDARRSCQFSCKPHRGWAAFSCPNSAGGLGDPKDSPAKASYTGPGPVGRDCDFHHPQEDCPAGPVREESPLTVLRQ